MSILLGAAIGSAAGLIVSSWQGFKDPPWEGFYFGKFLRSIVVGAVAGVVFAWAAAAGRIAVDNLGVLAFAIVAVERVFGEAYKGFFRRSAHAEYFKLLRRIGVPASVYPVKLLTGIGFMVGAYWLFRLLAFWLARMAGRFDSLFVPGLLVGLGGGLLVAIGGALKDSQFEGFIPAKFVRSPIVGALSGVLFVQFSRTWLLVALAVVGGERVGVELYKTFLRRQVRGIHAGKPLRYPEWFARRPIFAVSYGVAVAVCVFLLVA